MFVSYRQEGSEQRFYQEQSMPLPVWAVDVRDEAFMPNWAGLAPHPTDEFVFWNEKNVQQKMLQLRGAWDKLQAAGLLEEAQTLIQAASETSRLDEAYSREDFS